MEVSGKTKITGIFGYPIEHTISPRMHNAGFNALNLDICYIAFKVRPEELSDAVKAIRALNMLGVNITIPHKESVVRMLDRIDEEASFIGAINTIVNSEGTLVGYNTDGRGFMRSLEEENIDIHGKEICIIGAGGAARAISYYLSIDAKKISIFDIDQNKAKRLVNDLLKIRNNVFLSKNIDNVSSDIIINATPLGLKSDDPPPLNTDLISTETVVCDLVYKKTNLIREAMKKGAKTLDGLGMLLWQGILAFELWTGITPPIDVMKKALMSEIR
jgi:shikimate dehydrogenase